MDALPSRADVVVIGGIVGASVAFHLAEAGAGDVVLVERSAIACGSSGKPIGGVRAQFSDALNVELAARSLAAYERFGPRPGADTAVGRFLHATGFSRHGFCQAPATGEVIRDIVRGARPFVDVTPLRAERLADRAPILEANIV